MCGICGFTWEDKDLLSGDDVKPLPWVGCDSPRLREATANYYNCMKRLDLLVAEYALNDLILIRFGFMVPIILIGFVLSFVPYFKDRYHLVVMVTAVVVGGSIIVMIAIIQPPASDYYYAGLIMVLLFTYTFLQLRLLHAVISGLCIFRVLQK